MLFLCYQSYINLWKFGLVNKQYNNIELKQYTMNLIIVYDISDNFKLITNQIEQ